MTLAMRHNSGQLGPRRGNSYRSLYKLVQLSPQASSRFELKSHSSPHRACVRSIRRSRYSWPLLLHPRSGRSGAIITGVDTGRHLRDGSQREHIIRLWLQIDDNELLSGTHLTGDRPTRSVHQSPVLRNRVPGPDDASAGDDQRNVIQHRDRRSGHLEAVQVERRGEQSTVGVSVQNVPCVHVRGVHPFGYQLADGVGFYIEHGDRHRSGVGQEHTGPTGQ